MAFSKKVLALAMAEVAMAEKIWMSQWKVPGMSMQPVHFFRVDKEVNVGLQVLEPALLEKTAQKFPSVLVLPSRSFEDHLGEKAELCDAKGVLQPTSLPVDAYTLDASKRGSVIPKLNPGDYLIVLVQCATLAQNEVSKLVAGEIGIKYPHGYTPGPEKDLQNVYLLFFLAYTAMFVGWSVYCFSWRSVTLSIHKYIGAAFFMGLVEAFCWYASYYHWNLVGHRWKSMVHLACGGTVAKRAMCYLVAFLACRGVGVTKAAEQGSVMAKFLGLIVFYAITSHAYFLQSSAMQDSYIFLQDGADIQKDDFTRPILATVAECMILYWIFKSCDDTVDELKSTEQTIKLQVYEKMQNSLSYGLGFLFLAYAASYAGVHFALNESTEEKHEISNGLANAARLSLHAHAVPPAMFFIITAICAYLWRPNERSLDMAYSMQLNDKVDVEVGEDNEEVEMTTRE